RGGIAGGGDEITFVLPVLIIDHDHHLALADILNGVLDGIEGLAHACGIGRKGTETAGYGAMAGSSLRWRIIPSNASAARSQSKCSCTKRWPFSANRSRSRSSPSSRRM